MKRKTNRLQGWMQAGVAIAMLLTAAVSSASPQDDAASTPFLGGFLKETRIVYPLRVGDWEAQGEHLYDQPELGASVRYRHRAHEDRWIDLYFYPAGVLPPERLDTDAQRTLDELRSAIGQPGYYGEGDFDAPRSFSFTTGGTDARTVRARSAGMRLSRDSGAYHSALVLLVHDLYYVKGRYSIEADALSRDDTRTQLEAFMTEAVRAMRIASSGDCWMPLPIERLQGDPPKQGVLATSGGEGNDATEFLLADRVLARNPEGEAAQALMAIGMVMSGRLFPGCTGAEPSNPEVPEGSREIRLEYRGPATDGADPGRRLRGTRSAVG